MTKKKKQNIDIEDERFGHFMSDNSFEFDILMGRQFLETDSPFKVKYYKIDVINSKVDDLYGEAKPGDKKFFATVEFHVMLDIEDGETKYFGDDGIPRQDGGTLTFGIYLDEINEKKTEITRGDYISFNFSGEKERFFEIVEADNVSDVTSRTIGGYKPYWKKIEAIPVKEDVLPFIRNI